MILDILISTIDSGISRVGKVLLEPRKDVRYIIVHQYEENKHFQIPEVLKRNDVLLYRLCGKGLTKSRNRAIYLSTGDICLIADDDVSYKDKYLDEIICTYKTQKIDIGCFKIKTERGQPEYKNYPAKQEEIKSIYEYSPSSIEITFRRNSIIENKVEFDERFGLGTWLDGGEESLFIYDALRRGLVVQFIPYYIVDHPFQSSIKSFPKYDRKRVRVTGALDARINGYLAIMKSFGGTIRYLPDLIRHKKNPFKYFVERLSGVIYILRS